MQLYAYCRSIISVHFLQSRYHDSATLRDFVGVHSKEWFFKLILQVKEIFLEILVSLTGIISNDLLVHFSRYSRSSKLLFIEHTFIWKKDRDFFLSSNFSACISSTSKYLEFTTFPGSTFWSGKVFLNWLKKSKMGVGVKSIELFLLETFLLYNKVGQKSLLVKNPKGRIELQQ